MNVMVVDFVQFSSHTADETVAVLVTETNPSKPLVTCPVVVDIMS